MITMARPQFDPEKIQMAMPPETAVNPHDSLTVPILAAPVRPVARSSARTNELGAALPDTDGAAPANDTAAAPPAPKMSLLAPIEKRAQQRLMADYGKDASPYGSAENHPGFFGKLLHGLNVATGGANRRAWEEEGLENRLADLSKQESAENLQGAQAGNQTAQAGEHTETTNEMPGKTASEEGLQGAETRHLNDEAANLENPPPDLEIHDTEAGPILVNKRTGTAQHVDIDGQPVGPKLKLTQSQPIIGADGRPHIYMLDEKGNKVVDLGEHYERPININAGNKEAIAQRQSIFKTYQPVMDSAERMNVMTKNYEDAIKNHNQQAMLSLLYNHMGMTMGLQKGARMTQDLIREAQQSQPWLQGIKAKFDSNGYLTGVTLSPQQMRDMVSLAQDRYKEDVGKARNEAGYLGATDDGPARTPNAATINYYVNEAGGDLKKAKQLAAEDGWSVK